MTEREWLGSDDPGRMLGFLKGETSDRKLRLFACSVCRQLTSYVGTEDLARWRPTAQAEYLRGIEAAESGADGRRTTAAMKRSAAVLYDRRLALGCWTDEEEVNEWYALHLGGVAMSAKDYRVFVNRIFVSHPGPVAALTEKVLKLACFSIREIFGNPFRSLTLDCVPTPTVVSLAQSAYDERLLPSGQLDPVRLAVLADALEEAGASGPILQHLRGPGPHVRGCWALDLVLDRE